MAEDPIISKWFHVKLPLKKQTHLCRGWPESVDNLSKCSFLGELILSFYNECIVDQVHMMA